jgi:hypothetical protein
MLVRQAFTVALLVGLAGCAAPYTVREQRQPNPFAARDATFAVLPLDFSNAHIDEGPPTNVPWNDDDRAEFEHAKTVMNAAFQHEVLTSLHQGGIAAEPATSPGAKHAAFLIQPEVLEVTPGDFSGGVGHPATHVRIGVRIVDRSGQILDVVEVEHDTMGDPLAGTLDQRFHVDGSTVAERVASYVHERVTPGSELR